MAESGRTSRSRRVQRETTPERGPRRPACVGECGTLWRRLAWRGGGRARRTPHGRRVVPGLPARVRRRAARSEPPPPPQSHPPSLPFRMGYRVAPSPVGLGAVLSYEHGGLDIPLRQEKNLRVVLSGTFVVNALSSVANTFFAHAVLGGRTDRERHRPEPVGVNSSCQHVEAVPRLRLAVPAVATCELV